MRIKRNALALGLMLVSAACNTTPPAPTMPSAGLVRTRDSVVRATVTSDAISFSVVTTLTNVTSDTLHLHPCLQSPPFPPVVRLERLEGGEWRNVWGGVCTQALMLEPPRLLPGATRVDTIRVWGSRRANSYPVLTPPVAGTYRVVYGDVYRRWYTGAPPADAPPGSSLGEPVRDSLLRSNSFQVVE